MSNTTEHSNKTPQLIDNTEIYTEELQKKYAEAEHKIAEVEAREAKAMEEIRELQNRCNAFIDRSREEAKAINRAKDEIEELHKKNAKLQFELNNNDESESEYEDESESEDDIVLVVDKATSASEVYTNRAKGTNPVNSSSETTINITPVDSVAPTENKLVQHIEFNVSHHNNWSDQNTKTVEYWKSIAEEYMFTHSILLEKYQTKMDKALILALIIGSLSTIAAAISSAILAISSNLIWVAFGFNIALFVMNMAVTVINGVVKIYRWDIIVSSISAFIEKVNSFYATITSQLLLPEKLRPDAVDFIQNTNKIYTDITNHTPEVSQSAYDSANKKYKKYLGDNNSYCKHSHKHSKVSTSITME